METKELIGRLNIVLPGVSMISGGVSRDDESSEVFSSGQVFYLDRSHLKKIASGRSALRRICAARGVRFLGDGFAIADSVLPEVLSQLEAKRAEIEEEIEHFLAKMPALMAEWRALHPEIAPWAGNFPTVEQARRRMKVSLAVFKVTPDQSAGDDVIAEAGGLAGRALEEIAQDVRLSWSPKEGEVSQRARSIFNRAATKLRSLAILGSHLSDIADAIDQTMALLPREGRITGRDFVILSGLANSLMSPSAMLRMSEQIGQVAPADLWSSVPMGPVVLEANSTLPANTEAEAPPAEAEEAADPQEPANAAPAASVETETATSSSLWSW